MEAAAPLSKTRRELTPKVNHTKTTIVKSTPFLIRKHHLDDTQMRKALRYDDRNTKPSHPRTFSYKGELVTYKNTKTNPISLQPTYNQYLQQSNQSNYYNLNSQTHHKSREAPQHIPTNQQVPYFKNNLHSKIQLSENKDEQTQQYQKNYKNYGLESITSRRKQNEENQLHEIYSARKQMEKQAKKLRKLYKKKVQQNIKQISNEEVSKLEEQVHDLKVKALELQKQKLMDQLNVRLNRDGLEKKQRPMEKIGRGLDYLRIDLLLNKPKFREYPCVRENTDSSFSSFQFD